MTGPRRNIELKVDDRDPERSLAVCRALGAEDQGVLRQRDTYFWVHRGRLKLREEGGGAHLVHYERTDEAVPRASDFRLVPVPDPGEMRLTLEAALGIEVVVAKERRLLLWREVRIHLDRVEGLAGAFLELEAPADSGSDDEPARLVDELLTALDVDADRIVGPGYADLLREGGRTIAGA